jgi:hypothetical protein
MTVKWFDPKNGLHSLHSLLPYIFVYPTGHDTKIATSRVQGLVPPRTIYGQENSSKSYNFETIFPSITKVYQQCHLSPITAHLSTIRYAINPFTIRSLGKLSLWFQRVPYIKEIFAIPNSPQQNIWESFGNLPALITQGNSNNVVSA